MIEIDFPYNDGAIELRFDATHMSATCIILRIFVSFCSAILP